MGLILRATLLNLLESLKRLELVQEFSLMDLLLQKSSSKLILLYALQLLWITLEHASVLGLDPMFVPLNQKFVDSILWIHRNRGILSFKTIVLARNQVDASTWDLVGLL